MGSIIWINRKPNTWRAFPCKLKLKPELGGEQLINIFYGEFDDYPDGTTELSIYMRESIYINLLNNKYKIINNPIKLIIADENNNIISPIKEGYIY